MQAPEIDVGDYLGDETLCLRALREQARLPASEVASIVSDARGLVLAARERQHEHGGIDAFMREYDLSTGEGIALMCLAEALLRIPDADSADRLIADKLGPAAFERHLGTSESPFVNAMTWGLMISGSLVRQDRLHPPALMSSLREALGRLGEPVIRVALQHSMRLLGRQFVMGRSIEEAIARAQRDAAPGTRYSYDMLGEAALTSSDADEYAQAYAEAIDVVSQARNADAAPEDAPGVSVKLSALCPRFELGQRERAVREVAARLAALAAAAAGGGIPLTVDAEEADRLELTLEIFARVLRGQARSHWNGLGLAVQAYQKRAPRVIAWLDGLARELQCIVPVRLVKGAYWDTEIKRAQEQGLAGYPVFTRKNSTDVAYLACAKELLESAALYPQFATHNALAVAWISQLARGRAFEFQRLHGMGEALYASLAASGLPHCPCRVYAPVGSHEDLLPYLVRRLLENGANTSFVNRLADEALDVSELVRDPVAMAQVYDDAIPNPAIPSPHAIYGAARENSAGLNLGERATLERLTHELDAHRVRVHEAAPIIAGERHLTDWRDVASPIDGSTVGRVCFGGTRMAVAAIGSAHAAFAQWQMRPVAERAEVLRCAAAALEKDRMALVALIVNEAGRCIADALSEVREAVDFLRYYAYEAERVFGAPEVLRGPTGERNTLGWRGRGVFACISPWNFPVAIFTGQIGAALAAGNTVVAKPAEQTSLTAARIVELFYGAGIPRDALQFVPGDGPALGEAMFGDPHLAGVAFTGSAGAAHAINRALAAREGALPVLIAETGGVNAMIVDSSALPEQVVKDVAQSAFNSAGQRCSALRLLCVQEETADRVVELLCGHMDEIVVGSPRLFSTDVGPVIDEEAHAALSAYVERHAERVAHRSRIPDRVAAGRYIAPTLIEIDRVADLEGEVFGPVLHVLRYDAKSVDALIDDINGLGFGLTLGVHSRIDEFAERVVERARVGNVYVNRNMIGAVVGVQPFGGMGLSGTGPKAGGPNYLQRFAVEQSVAVNTAAVGGNATLLALNVDAGSARAEN